ncbi:MAG: TldD/PmbA family protein [Phycisphaerae bacterium]|nr:TldD/PmbA family protein [Phycisphaerae bacterium]
MILEQLIEKAMTRAQAAEATLSRKEETDVSFEYDKLKSVKSQQATDIEVRVILGGKLGSSRTTDPKDTDGVVHRALETAEFGGPAHLRFAGPAQTPRVELFDPSVPDLPKQKMVDVGQEMIDRLKAYDSEILAGAGVSATVAHREILTSEGATHAADKTDLACYVGGERIRGTDILMAWHVRQWRKNEIDHREIADKAVEKFRLAEKIAPIESGEMPVIFSPDGMSVLALALTLGINGKHVVLGSSPLAGRLGDEIADERLTLIDDPLIDYASGSTSVDEEGVPAQATPVIENGILRNFLYDLDAAGRAGARSTGNGRDCRPTNLVVKPGKTSLEAMIADTKLGLLVHSVLGLGQGNAISGAFSVNVWLGYKIENGQIVGRVKDVMLAGNAYDALKNIDAIGDTPQWTQSHTGGAAFLPPVKIASLSVTAK